MHFSFCIFISIGDRYRMETRTKKIQYVDVAKFHRVSSVHGQTQSTVNFPSLIQWDIVRYIVQCQVQSMRKI